MYSVTPERYRYIATAITIAQPSPVSTARWRSSRSSTSGACARSCWKTQATSATAAAASRPSTLAEVQPQPLPSVIASSSATRPMVSSTAPGTSSVARGRWRLEGTTAKTQTRATPLTRAPNQ